MIHDVGLGAIGRETAVLDAMAGKMNQARDRFMDFASISPAAPAQNHRDTFHEVLRVI
jgi:hypothetical protein